MDKLCAFGVPKSLCFLSVQKYRNGAVKCPLLGKMRSGGVAWWAEMVRSCLLVYQPLCVNAVCLLHRITESFRLEKTTKVILSNHQPIPACPLTTSLRNIFSSSLPLVLSFVSAPHAVFSHPTAGLGTHLLSWSSARWISPSVMTRTAQNFQDASMLPLWS